MPNSKMWEFWKDMKELNDCMEIKAKHCNADTAQEILYKIKSLISYGFNTISSSHFKENIILLRIIRHNYTII